MSVADPLTDMLEAWAGAEETRRAIACTIGALAASAADIADLIARGALAGALGEAVGGNAAGDVQKRLDVRAHERLMETLADSPVAVVGSEEGETAIVLDRAAPLAVAMDPLDGSSNIDTNAPVGTIFSILPAAEAANGSADAALLRPGSRQVAAGFFVYGPQTVLAFSVGEGAHFATLDRDLRRFVVTRRGVRLPDGRREYAINASNARFWDAPVRAYVEDCVAGAEGPALADYNMRWVASLVAEAYRILVRGGVFLYPRDARKGYRSGWLRHVYEANPIAWLIEQAGGAATDGSERILDLAPAALHARTPLVFGSREEVDRVARYHAEPPAIIERAPLFAKRGLFRA
jgi:fructose-1,6-bisphosphatase I